MIKFFRNIRQKLFLENKTSKYFKYAIGEIILVVIGILIALQTNEWKQNQNLKKERTELINDLLIDFTNTQKKLDSLSIFQEKSYKNMTLFFEDVYIKRKELSLDSLQSLALNFFSTTNFNPSLTTYNNANSSGKLSLLKNKKINYLFSDFFEKYNSYKQINTSDSNNFFSGTIWDLKKEIGSVSQLFDIAYYEKVRHTKISLKKYMDLVNSKIVFIALENRKVIVSNLKYEINTLSNINKKIIEELKNSYD
ncbi:hypothetical protein OD91_2358 [Lutibacter sp. Hel_I_33_5]|uniref:DUF6090 family protein n=1 Tax=Lutibacter sp. Hel_I_33_5 TaxID=1566289 RepID=UPI0011A220A1|nr:DUF6090 family protein [Lutibacter sp. Hel_I_33_5]TVZ57052.1 hypothetical protein OD91_2358 [Lutibacter sp. Hel_I_33_5]